MINVENALKIVVKTGKYQIGGKKTLNLVKRGLGKLVLVANNCPKALLENINIYCKLANISVYNFRGSNWDLGFLCGKTHMVSVLTILEPGDSDILKLTEQPSN